MGGGKIAGLFYTRENQLRANLCVQGQPTNMVSQLWWRHDCRSEKILLGDNGCVQGI